MRCKVPGTIDKTYVDTLLSHKRKRTDEDESELLRLRNDRVNLLVQYQTLNKENAKLEQKIKEHEETIDKTATALTIYAEAMEACKPIILDAMESKFLAEMRGSNADDEARMAKAKEKAEAEYKTKFEVSEITMHAPVFVRNRGMDD
ncbi:hypothetical protein A1F94_013262 [Pyrenophora tritici-repentis]|nr:hypothetical protein A1F94_013262 [Pyrenophora tritici-repentis]